MGIIPFTHTPMRLTWVNILSEVAPVAKIPPFFSKPRPKPDYSHYFLSSSDYGEWGGDNNEYRIKNKKQKEKKETHIYDSYKQF